MWRITSLSLALISICILAYYTIVCIEYVQLPSLFDHIEPSIICLAQLVTLGKSIYSDIDGPDIHGFFYGPSTYLAFSLPLILPINPMIACKIMGVLLGIGSLLLLLISLSRLFSRKIALISTAICAIIFLMLGHCSFSVRADSVVIFAISLICLGKTVKNINLGIIISSFGAAIAVSSKVHALLYVVPILLAYGPPIGRKPLIKITIVSIMLFLLPFTFYHVFSIDGFARWLLMSLKHRFSINILRHNFQFVMTIIFPLIVFAGIDFLGNRGKLIRRHATMSSIIVALICVLVVCLIASKAGAGLPHLLPFGFVNSFALAAYLSRIDHEKTARLLHPFSFAKITAALCIPIWFLVIVSSLISTQKAFMRDLKDNRRPSINQELSIILDKYGKMSMAMGYSCNEAYDVAFYKPLIFKSTKEIFIDAAALMDIREAGRKFPKKMFERIKTEYYDIFLIPFGCEPFSMDSFYDRQDLFSREFQSEFLSNYILIDSSCYFGIWMANRLYPAENRTPSMPQ